MFVYKTIWTRLGMLPSVALRCKHREDREGKEKEEEGRKKGTELWQIQHVFKLKKKKS